MRQILLRVLFILISVHYSYCYTSFNELKLDMERRVTRISTTISNIYVTKCKQKQFQCQVSSFNLCEGTGERQCLYEFPITNKCSGVSKYSMTSGVRIPNSVASSSLTEEMKFFICKTAQPQFQSVFQQLIDQNDRRYAWVGFGSASGAFRVSPGFKYQHEKDFQSCSNYDPRLRQWYASNAFQRKKMIILVQNSKPMHQQPSRYTSIQLSLQALLKTAQPGDLFNVIQFSDQPSLLFANEQMKLLSLGQEIIKYNNATKTDGQFYQSVGNNISKSNSAEANYKKALQMAIQVLQNSKSTNPQMQNFILMFTGFKPSNFSSTYSQQLLTYLQQKQLQLKMNFYFFGFGVNLLDPQTTSLLNSLACKFDGIYTDLSDITYQSMFLDQAEGYYEFLSQGNQVNGERWTEFYQDAFGLGTLVTVVKPVYYVENNISRLVGMAGIDVMIAQLTAYKTLYQIHQSLQITEYPFKKNISMCQLETIRRNYKCHDSKKINCTNKPFCQTLTTTSSAIPIIRETIDTSQDQCCVELVSSSTGIIVGLTLGLIAAVALILIALYFLICRQKQQNHLELTYTEIFSQFKDFDQTRIRSDSEISLIKD